MIHFTTKAKQKPETTDIEIDVDSGSDVEIKANGIIIGWLMHNTGALNRRTLNFDERRATGLTFDRDDMIKVNQ